MNKYIPIIFSCIAFSCNSQVEKKKSKSELLNLVYELCPTANVLDVEKKSDKYTEIEYLCNEKIVEIGVLDGKVVYQEVEAEKRAIPYSKIIHKIEKKYPGWVLDEINKVTTNRDTFLKVEIMKEGIEQNVFFTLDGKNYNAKSIIASDQWSVETLSSTTPFQQSNYQFLTPSNYYEMPDLLQEISGITFLDSVTILCVQDELGIVFSYNFKTKETENFYRFTDKGDFEDITIAGNTVHVLRSDGAIFKFDIHNKQYNKRVALAVTSLDIEGLFYNPEDDFFYLASKEAEVFKNGKEIYRPIYRYLNNDKYELETYFEINTKEINQALTELYPGLVKNEVRFNPSAIAFHPITKSIFVLSANDRILAEYNSDKELIQVYPLPAEQFYKPEGLMFGKDGTLYISNEGDKTGLIKGNILAFRYSIN